MCVVCAREEEGTLKSVLPIILRAKPIIWVSLEAVRDILISEYALLLRINRQPAGPGISTSDLSGLSTTQPMRIVAQ